MTTIAWDHSLTVPPAQSVYRCGSCGADWIRAVRSGMAFNGSDWLSPDADGWYSCCAGRRFRWGDASTAEA